MGWLAVSAIPTVLAVEPTSLGFQTDIALLRLGGSRVEDRGDHLIVRTPHNPAHWWGNFLLLAELPAPEVSGWWLDRFAAEFPTARHVALGFDARAGSPADPAWFTSQGFDAEASVVMTATEVHELSNPNSEAVCRRLQSNEDWAQSVKLQVRCHDRPGEPARNQAFAAARAHTNRQIVTAGHGAWFGAFVNSRLVAQMGLVTARRGLARFQSVETDPDYRRRGLARSLIHHVSRDGFETLGARTLVIVADPDSFALDLYRSVGFVTAETQLQVERPPPD
jgi:ribosomal protein S18 acetylase RimI-like enzyme